MALIDKLNAVGNAIRAKTGKSDKLTLDQMPTEIAGIETSENLDDVLTEQEKLIAELQAILKVRASDDDYTTETWTFTLEDGTTLEKVVVLSV